MNLVPGRPSAPAYRDCPTAVATEVLLLRPHSEVAPAAVREDPVGWPLFVMVVTEPVDPAGLPLFELLDQPRYPNEMLIVAAEPEWSVLDPATALLAVTIRTVAPIVADLRVVLPAAPVLDDLDMVAHGAPIGITTRDRASRLRGRVDVKRAVRDIVVLTCLPSAEPADLAGVLRVTREA